MATRRPPRSPVLSLFDEAQPSASDSGRSRRSSLVKDNDARAKTVTQVVNIARMTLTRELGRITVVGEVSGFKVYGEWGHWFFSLKDDRQSLSCFMRNRDAARLRLDMKDGLQVMVSGRLDFAPGRSQMQLVVDSLVLEGQGRLAATFERLKSDMQDAGWFALERKRPLPKLPHTVGVVTSSAGAAVHDVCRVLRERHPGVRVVLAATRVQGDKASVDIADAIRRLDDSGLCDVLIVTRGGGAPEDLFAFNMKAVCKAVLESTTPVIAGVGHESDVTLVEHVADARAATPSHAAQLAVPDHHDLLRRVHGQRRRLHGALQQRLRRAERALQSAQQRLPPVGQHLAHSRAALDDAAAHLDDAIVQRLQDAQVQLADHERRLALQSPQSRLAQHKRWLQTAHARLLQSGVSTQHREAQHQLWALQRRLADGMRRQQEQRREALAHVVGQLQALSPLAVLERGYALARTDDGDVVRDASKLSTGQALSLRLHQGQARVQVVSVDD